MSKTYLIEDGGVFAGLLNQFKDCFFDNADNEIISDYCKEKGWKLTVITSEAFYVPAHHRNEDVPEWLELSVFNGGDFYGHSLYRYECIDGHWAKTDLSTKKTYEYGDEKRIFASAASEVDIERCDWQSVEDAPTDGREVLACFKSFPGSVEPWVMFFAYATKDAGVYRAGYAKPTHWKPKPSPPKE